uniref:PBPe domain-containing protein n=1 Tax=Mesocestoides corti TaxID=53468 RepID=A0A5K3FDE5_MESCO
QTESLFYTPNICTAGSKYRDEFSEIILQLQESQTLEQIRRYWWRNFSIAEPCESLVSKSSSTTSLGHEQIGGCFVMCLFGLAVSILISLQEFLYKAYLRSKVTKRSFCEEAAREFRFSMACSSTRDFGAESALTLPPPPSNCALTSKECRIATLAYAPCLPAVVKPLPSITAATEAEETKSAQTRLHNPRPSMFDVVRMLRRTRSSDHPQKTGDTKFDSIQQVMKVVLRPTLQDEESHMVSRTFCYLSGDSFQHKLCSLPNIMAVYMG